ncbi:MAG: hypothetical protein ACREBW_03915, partial [Candidatus Micrarchaeaceae archaeon]
AQCTGSGMFLAASLALALPGCSPKSIHGHSLPRQGGNVSTEGHEQATILYENKLYIVDATGRETETATSASASQVERWNITSLVALGAFTVRSTLHQIGRSLQPHKKPAIPQDTRPPIAPEHIQTNRKAQLEQTMGRLEQLLQTVFKAENHDILYERLGPLTRDDPNRLTITALAEAQQGNWQNIEQTSRYIADYMQLDETRRMSLQKQYGIPAYTNRHMSLLASQLDAALRLAPQHSRS